MAAMRTAVINYELEACKNVSTKALEFGIDPTYAIMEGLAWNSETSCSFGQMV